MTSSQQRIVAEMSALLSDALVLEHTDRERSADHSGISPVGHVAIGMADVLAHSLEGFDTQAFLTDCTQKNAERVVRRSRRRLVESGRRV